MFLPRPCTPRDGVSSPKCQPERTARAMRRAAVLWPRQTARMHRELAEVVRLATQLWGHCSGVASSAFRASRSLPLSNGPPTALTKTVRGSLPTAPAYQLCWPCISWPTSSPDAAHRAAKHRQRCTYMPQPRGDCRCDLVSAHPSRLPSLPPHQICHRGLAAGRTSHHRSPCTPRVVPAEIFGQAMRRNEREGAV